MAKMLTEVHKIFTIQQNYEHWFILSGFLSSRYCRIFIRLKKVWILKIAIYLFTKTAWGLEISRRKTDGGNSNFFRDAIFDRVVRRGVDPGGSQILGSVSLGSKQGPKKFAAMYYDPNQNLATSNVK